VILLPDPKLTRSVTTKIHGLDNDVSSAKPCITCLNALLKRLYALDKLEWLEQTLITRVYLTGKYPSTQSPGGIKDLQRVFDGKPSVLYALIAVEVRKNLATPMSSKSVCAVQMVISQISCIDISCSGKSQIRIS